MKEKVSAIIVNYNRAGTTCDCIESIVKQTHQLHEIIVVDNNSSDDSLRAIQKRFPKVILINNKENVGACIARNQAINVSNGDYLWFLDNDTVVLKKNTLHSMLELLKDKSIGAVGGESWIEEGIEKGMKKRILLKNGESVWENVKIGKEIICSDYLSTANMLARKKDVIKTKGFTQIYFYLYEDIDLSFKLKKQGLKLVSTIDTLAHHLEIQDKARITNFFRINKNRIIFIVLDKGVYFYFLLPFLDLVYLFNPMKIDILKQKGKTEESQKNSLDIIKILKVGLSYVNGTLKAYLWVLFNMGKVLKEKKKDPLSL
jgi:GT2 family glycosyltransferase